MNYLQLATKHSNRIGFGFLHYFFSMPGQSVLISLFIPHFNEELQMNNTEFGVLYSIATLLSAFTLPVFGTFIDRFKLRYVSIANGFLLCLFLLLISKSTHWLILFLGLYGLRFSGQGMMALIASTGIARFFGKQRGKALSLSGLGLSVGEALLPAVVVSLINGFDWQVAFQLMGLGILFVFVPLSLLLVKKKDGFQLPETDNHSSDSNSNQFSRKRILMDLRFYAILIPAVFPAFVLTGLFIHQNLLALHKGWSMKWLASCFVGFGLVKIVTYFIAGHLVDRFSAKKIFPFFLLPMAFGFLCLALSDHPYIALIYLIFSGITTSFSAVIGSAVWAEVYGVSNLGAVKSMISTFGVSATSAGAILFGWLLSGAQIMQVTLLITICVIVILSITAKKAIAILED